jgi:hypothetical protein
MEIVRLEPTGTHILKHELDRIRGFYVFLIIIGAIMFALGLII